ncbi:MAG: 4-(cytidine 5'-diphospho)-2-C-methyl-D-erythritol kinase [Planctomycetota bacterium]|nr:4-(cytidine 5'-diphospho)-2-C-methyl-D-erythritol kinase [Planctomycetota bacterium]
MRLISPSKINLHLRIGSPGADGFHPIVSWMCTTGLADALEFEPTASCVRLNCDVPGLPVDQRNLIVRAAEALLAISDNSKMGADIRLIKKIPMGGGLGGGSSNAAATLVGLNRLWKLNLPVNRLAEIGARLGSDVPFFFHGPSSICTGLGQFVMPIATPRPRFVVLVFPALSMPTPRVYRQFDEMKLGSVDAMERQPDWGKWTQLKADELLPLLVNDLEAPAFSLQPVLGELRKTVERELDRIVRMSGSGSTLFTLTDTQEEAEEAALRLSRLSMNASAFLLARPTAQDEACVSIGGA